MAIQPVTPTDTEPAGTGSHSVAHAGGGREEEERLVRYILLAMCVCVPLLVGFWVGLVALAVTIAAVGYAAPLLMAIVIGVLAGAFFGAWVGFVLYSRSVD